MHRLAGKQAERAYKVEGVTEILAGCEDTVGKLLRKEEIKGRKRGHGRVTEDKIKKIFGLQGTQKV